MHAAQQPQQLEQQEHGGSSKASRKGLPEVVKRKGRAGGAPKGQTAADVDGEIDAANKSRTMGGSTVVPGGTAETDEDASHRARRTQTQNSLGSTLELSGTAAMEHTVTNTSASASNGLIPMGVLEGGGVISRLRSSPPVRDAPYMAAARPPARQAPAPSTLTSSACETSGPYASARVFRHSTPQSSLEVGGMGRSATSRGDGRDRDEVRSQGAVTPPPFEAPPRPLNMSHRGGVVGEVEGGNGEGERERGVTLLRHPSSTRSLSDSVVILQDQPPQSKLPPGRRSPSATYTSYNGRMHSSAARHRGKDLT